jgi:hypothetical protein
MWVRRTALAVQPESTPDSTVFTSLVFTVLLTENISSCWLEEDGEGGDEQPY